MVTDRTVAEVPASALREGDVVQIGNAWHNIIGVKRVGGAARLTFAFFAEDIPLTQKVRAELRTRKKEHA
jgi:hypothetical protein